MPKTTTFQRASTMDMQPSIRRDFSMSSELVVIEEARKVIMALSGIPINEEDDMIFSQILDKRLAARKRTLL